MSLKIYNRGFEIGIHSNTHPDMAKLTKSQMKEELEINLKLTILVQFCSLWY